LKFTFGIITGGAQENNINAIIDSIEMQQISELDYEIIIIGSCNISRRNTSVISFNENEKRAWISRKKNILTKEALFENIVYLHDYVKLMPGWYEGFLKFGNNFQVCMNPILNTDNTRFRDWVLYDLPLSDMERDEKMIPYNMTHLSKWMYFSGTYWIAKKSVMEEFPLNELCGHGQGEDVVWSLQIRDKYDFNINTQSIVKLLPSTGKGWNKGKKGAKFYEMREKIIEKLEKIKQPTRVTSPGLTGFLKRHGIQL
tara:strand:+ start:3273 stop:4040 length:768 start_codon:yes stop_codon:yes gene_type:complete